MSVLARYITSRWMHIDQARWENRVLILSPPRSRLPIDPSRSFPPYLLVLADFVQELTSTSCLERQLRLLNQTSNPSYLPSLSGRILVSDRPFFLRPFFNFGIPSFPNFPGPLPSFFVFLLLLFSLVFFFLPSRFPFSIPTPLSYFGLRFTPAAHLQVN